MSRRGAPTIRVSCNPNGGDGWVVSIAAEGSFRWFLFDTLQAARRAAAALAIEGIHGDQDFAVWVDDLPHSLRASAIEATIDLADALFADAMARKGGDRG